MKPTAGVYLDANATTPADATVLSAMARVQSLPTNAGSPHWAGHQARQHLDRARSEVASLFFASPTELVFTSGATESNALAIEGVARAGTYHARGRRKVVSAAWEHPAVLQPLNRLRRDGWDVVVVDIDAGGAPSMDQLEAAIDDQTLLVSIMAANNETGVRADLEQIGAWCRADGVLLHSDATQLAPWGPIDVDRLGLDLVSISGHKMHGPQGIGALYVQRDVRMAGQIVASTPGGGQERGLRGGTVNIAGAVGLGTAATIVSDRGKQSALRVAVLRDQLEFLLLTAFPEASINGGHSWRTPGTTNVSFDGLPAEAIMAGAPTLAVSTGSACHAGAPEPSHVLTAMGLSADLADSSIRFSLSRETTAADITDAVQLLASSISTVLEVVV